MKLRNILAFVRQFIWVCLCCMSLANGADLTLETISIYDIKDISTETEVVSIQESTQRIALSCSNDGIVDIISIKEPTNPVLLRRFKVTKDAETSSVAFHPSENYFAVAIVNPNPFTAGQIQIHDADTGEILKILISGVHPNGLAFSPNGKFLVVANEGNAYRYNGKQYESPDGSITHIHFKKGLEDVVGTLIDLDDYSNVDGMLHKSHARKIERIVIDGNNKEEIRIPIKDNTPANTEPEFVAFSPDSRKAYISLQENNGIAVVDTASATIEKVFGLGITEHLADIKDNDKIKFKKKIRALREPDGISITPDGKYLLTADEGETDPKTSKVTGNKPTGGGRTLSVFDAITGQFIADTGSQLDEMAHAVGLYQDSSSEHEGSEPENVISFEVNNRLYAAVSLESANAVALVSLRNPAQPKVISVEPVDPKAIKGEEFAPEGLAYIELNNKYYIFSANEKSGTLTVMQIKEKL